MFETRDAELERLRAEYEDELDLKRAALKGTSELMGAEIERLRAENAALKALLREADRIVEAHNRWFVGPHGDLHKRIHAALGETE